MRKENLFQINEIVREVKGGAIMLVLKGFNDLRKVWSPERDLEHETIECRSSQGTVNFGGKSKGTVGRVTPLYSSNATVPWSNRPFHPLADAVTAANSIYQMYV